MKAVFSRDHNFEFVEDPEGYDTSYEALAAFIEEQSQIHARLGYAIGQAKNELYRIWRREHSPSEAFRYKDSRGTKMIQEAIEKSNGMHWPRSIARAIDRSQSFTSFIIRGKCAIPFDLVDPLAAALGLDPEELRAAAHEQDAMKSPRGRNRTAPNRKKGSNPLR